MTKKVQGTLIKVVIGFSLLFIFTLVIALTSPRGSVPQQINNSSNNLTTIQKMAIAFDGNYSEKEIKDRITEAMVLYNVPITDEDYSRAGSTLVTLKQEQGIEEMLILDYMINKLYTPSIKLTFPQAAGWSVSALKTGTN